jgi:hypothetical protein
MVAPLPAVSAFSKSKKTDDDLSPLSLASGKMGIVSRVDDEQ